MAARTSMFFDLGPIAFDRTVGQDGSFRASRKDKPSRSLRTDEKPPLGSKSSPAAAKAYAAECARYLSEIDERAYAFSTQIKPHLATLAGKTALAFVTFGITGGMAALSQDAMNKRFTAYEAKTWDLFDKYEAAYDKVFSYCTSEEEALDLLRQAGATRQSTYADDPAPWVEKISVQLKVRDILEQHCFQCLAFTSL